MIYFIKVKVFRKS